MKRACARQIVTRLGGEAYRRPLTAAEIDRIMPFYEGEAAKNGFEAGVRASLEAILASPYFIFRLEKAPTDARSGGTYRVADIDLASRLSFFLWGEPPDQELIAAAGRKELSTAAGLEKQARRMLADPKRVRASPSGSRRSGCACRTSRRCVPIRISIRTSTRTSPRRCAPRRSCSSTASSRRIAACSISIAPTTRS